MERREEAHHCSIAKQTILTTHPSGLQTRVSVELANFDALCLHECSSKKKIWESPFLSRRILGSAHGTPVLGRRSDLVNEGRLSAQCTPVMNRRQLDSPGGSPLPSRHYRDPEDEDLDNAVISGWLKFRDNKRIDGGTGQSETCGSVLERSVKCANAMREIGLKRGDIIILMAPCHIDLCIPYYAALYLGVIIAPIDRTFEIKELEYIFNIDEPKAVFCQSDRAKDVRVALDNCNFQDAKVITFDNDAGAVNNAMYFQDLLSKHGNKTTIDNFKASDFDPADTIAILVSTSGSTGLPKQSVLTHKNFCHNGHYIWGSYTQFPTPIGMSIVLTPIQWLTAIFNFNMSPILRFTRLQSSSYLTQQHCYDLINNYRPNFAILSPTLLTTLFKPEDRDKCDFSSFDLIYTGGSAVSAALIDEVKSIYPKTDIFNAYGLTEIGGFAFYCTNDAPGSSGNPTSYLQYRLVDIDTKEDILEPNKSGELWLKGPSVFKEYYKNPTETEKAFSEDGWLKTGDIFYRDEHWNFYCVDRLKMLIRYIDHSRGLFPLISPVEIQNVIRQHPGVLDVAVTGIPDGEHGELPVACVVRRTGFTVTAQEIKDLVKKTLSDGKQLRGGVIFLDEIPVSATTKINYKKVKEIAMERKRE